MRTNRKKEKKKWKKEGREERREKQRTRRNDRTLLRRDVYLTLTREALRSRTMSRKAKECENLLAF